MKNFNGLPSYFKSTDMTPGKISVVEAAADVNQIQMFIFQW